jgi:hypothetical protein
LKVSVSSAPPFGIRRAARLAPSVNEKHEIIIVRLKLSREVSA